MPSKQEVTRERVVQFYETHKSKGKKFTVDHFVAEGMSSSGVYKTLRVYVDRKTTIRKAGSGQTMKVMTKDKLRSLYRTVNHSDKYNYSSAARKFGTTDKTIKRWLQKKNIRRYKKKKSPEYTDDQKQEVKKQCRWLYRNYRCNDFILDDEKYFTKTHSLNNSFMSSPNKSRNKDNVRHKFKTKFEPKLMLWVAISKNGISEPYFQSSGLAVNQNIYLEKCLKDRLVPFIREKHSDNNYVFWADKASSHYPRSVVQYLNENNIKFVPKERNPTNVPQCRPIEDFFGYLCRLVYAKGWSAKTIPQLERRIRSCLQKVDPNVVTAFASSVPKRLKKCGQSGPESVVH